MGREATARSDYEQRAGRYGSQVKTYRDPVLAEMMLDGLQPLPEVEAGYTRKALDLACGRGDSSVILRDNGFDVRYFDLTRKMIDMGMQAGTIPPGAQVVIGDLAEELPYEPGEFHVVMNRYSFHDVSREEQPKLLSRLRSVIKPDGKLQIVDMCCPNSEEYEPGVAIFYDGYHGLKSRDKPRRCWIADRIRLRQQFLDAGFGDLQEDWYRSNVITGQWLKERQITRERYDFLNRYILEHARQFPEIANTFAIGEESFEIEEGVTEPSVKISFPVIVLTGTK